MGRVNKMNERKLLNGIEPFLSYDEAFGWLLGVHGAMIRIITDRELHWLMHSAASDAIQCTDNALRLIAARDADGCISYEATLRRVVKDYLRGKGITSSKGVSAHYLRTARYFAAFFVSVVASILEAIDHDRHEKETTR